MPNLSSIKDKLKNDLQVRIHRNVYSPKRIGEFEILVWLEARPGEIGIPSQQVVFEVKKESEGLEFSPLMNIGRNQVQQIMDDLWNYGIRPSELQYTQEHIQALNKHLSDMKALVEKGFKVKFE